ncbi:WD40 repeat-like protein [Basidiobolus meristosporus CBS 931.73]|uniref:WD40 repeat-like protein n=1 Tax=Basidiobolus meristosporus CBS 931.73 TaxID=1314790 RepID=A0A1Y1Z0H4_9FUNG|nr:WD40 repeat-like protein [Basidiobolus meristosporus CBS 931.73]|eukprot:ORY03437.1 WD40 repeat-like protein [Basidiobolus meristosporus CBS 931.73]
MLPFQSQLYNRFADTKPLPTTYSSDFSTSWKSPISFNSNGALTALSACPDQEQVVIAGREVLKILSVTEQEATEVLNLRAGSKLNLNFSINDVKWLSRGKIATAATNGAILLWDLNRTGQKIERVISEHSRAVNRISYESSSGFVLISASQDSTMRLWDLREKAASKFTFHGKSESVRDVQFNPLNPTEFIAAFENGTIQKWDIRNPSVFEKKISAHYGIALSVDWHSDGRFVASGGRDKMIKIWDMKSDGRKPQAYIQTIASVARVQWRPGHEYHIASCALNTDNRIVVQDIRRPYIAKFFLDDHENVATGFLWRGPDVLWSCSKDRNFIRHDVRNAVQPLDLLSTSSLGWNAYGDVAFTTEDKSVADDGFRLVLGTSPLKKTTRRTSEMTEQSSQCQNTGIIHLPTFDYESFIFMAENYEISSDNLWEACEHNAKVAHFTQQFRTAQTWKIIQMLYATASKPKETVAEGKSYSPASSPLDQKANIKIQILPTMANSELTEESQWIENSDLYDTLESDSDSESDDSDSLLTKPFKSETRTNSETVVNTFALTEEPDLEWGQEAILNNLMEYYGEKGDVQMCVTLLLVLDKHIKHQFSLEEQWFWSYIDLLHRFKLWSAAAAVRLACKLASVRQQSQESTTIHTSCNYCFKPLLNSKHGYWVCDKCRKLLNPCSLCHQTVRGLYVWCQGCSHGGHLLHMQEWFKENSTCPTGCGHQCSFTTTSASDPTSLPPPSPLPPPSSS